VYESQTILYENQTNMYTFSRKPSYSDVIGKP